MTLLFADLMDHALAYAGDDATAAGTTKCRQAVQNAYRVMPTRHEWTYLWALGRVQSVASYQIGTVEYVQSTNTLTLTDGTWPAWAANGYLVILNRPYQVRTRVSDTVLNLDPATAPTFDIPADTPYMLAQDQYPLPSDFLCIDETVINEVGAVLSYMHPRNWASERKTNTGPGQPWMFSVIGSRNDIGAMRMVLWPPPDAVYAVDFLYRRTLRPMVYEQVSDGHASVSSGGTGVTGTGSRFKSGMVGAFVRFAADAQDLPTGPGGGNPAVFESKITAVASGTALTIADQAPQDFSGVSYVISDPVDVDSPSMADYMLREVENQFRILARAKPLDAELREYELSMTRAREADNRATTRSASLRKQTRRSGFIHYPIQFAGG